MNPFFSIIIATYQCEQTLRRCLQSLVEQNEKSFEILIVDGASKDHTVTIIQEFREKYKNHFTFFVSEKDSGVYSAWNKALPHASGQWVYFLGADDFLWNEHVLTHVKRKLETLSEDQKIAYGKIAVVSQNSEEVLYEEGKPWSSYRWRYRHEMVLPHQATFHSRLLFSDQIYFNEKFKVCGDVEFLMREFIKKQKFPVFLNLPTFVAGMRVGGLSSQYQNVPLIISELKEIRKIYSLGFSYRIFFREFRFKLRAQIKKRIGEKLTDVLVHFYRFCLSKGSLRNYKK